MDKIQSSTTYDAARAIRYCISSSLLPTVQCLGCPANYVVTEQILKCGDEELSYTIVRGSVPVYWYQPLTNYRPKPVILCTPGMCLIHIVHVMIICCDFCVGTLSYVVVRCN